MAINFFTFTSLLIFFLSLSFCQTNVVCFPFTFFSKSYLKSVSKKICFFHHILFVSLPPHKNPCINFPPFPIPLYTTTEICHVDLWHYFVYLDKILNVWQGFFCILGKLSLNPSFLDHCEMQIAQLCLS